MRRLLVINPGSTSTRVAVFEDLNCVMERTVLHHTKELSRYACVADQLDMRRQCVLQALREASQPLRFDAVVGRGGLARAMASGTYEVTDQMVDEQRHAEHQHACDLGCVIAKSIADEIPGCRSYIADPGTTDELAPEARVSGLPQLPRICIWHALNQKAIARRYAREHHTRYEDLNLIICHLGGGISIAAHQHGRAIDANNALDGEGPFSPERAGSLPVAALVRLCFSGTMSEEDILKSITGHGGVLAHLGTKDMQKVTQMIADGDEKARLIVSAMVWHTAKAIVSEAAVLCGPPDAILLTGGMAKSDYITGLLKQRVAWLAPVQIYPGQDEMLALAENGLRALAGTKQ